jgi:hypothetical protein
MMVIAGLSVAAGLMGLLLVLRKQTGAQAPA